MGNSIEGTAFKVKELGGTCLFLLLVFSALKEMNCFRIKISAPCMCIQCCRLILLYATLNQTSSVNVVIHSIGSTLRVSDGACLAPVAATVTSSTSAVSTTTTVASTASTASTAFTTIITTLAGGTVTVSRHVGRRPLLFDVVVLLVEGNGLTFVQTLEAVLVDGTEVYKHIFRSVGGGDETKTLVAKELDGALSCHGCCFPVVIILLLLLVLFV
mmetsp:Transcript_17180/g.41715  ORF Transcript_17180/g.41715 Transcript_17180/m.41715 type:complete len:215 (+) Transcript_17180:458-1102(+)